GFRKRLTRGSRIEIAAPGMSIGESRDPASQRNQQRAVALLREVLNQERVGALLREGLAGMGTTGDPRLAGQPVERRLPRVPLPESVQSAHPQPVPAVLMETHHAISKGAVRSIAADSVIVNGTQLS